MYYKGATIGDTIFYGAVYYHVFPSAIVTYHVHCHSLEKCLALVATIKFVHSSVNSHKHDRNLIQTGGQSSQQCKICRQGAAHFFKTLEMNNKGLIHFSTKQIYKWNFVFIF